MFSPKGKFAWYELMTSDTVAAGAFYASVVGWTPNVIPHTDPSVPPYTTFNLGTAGVAGMMAMPGHSAWVGYIAVADVDTHIDKIVEAGGKQLRPAQDVPGMLRFAVMQDPQGAVFVVFSAAPPMPAAARPAPPTSGTIGWHELYTTDLGAATGFYNTLFGWTKVSDMDMGPMGTYRIFDEGDHAEMGDGGMMLKAPEMPVPCWAFYILVDAMSPAIERLNAGGGKVLMGPHQVPGGTWVVQAQDPLGANFALMSQVA